MNRLLSYYFRSCAARPSPKRHEPPHWHTVARVPRATALQSKSLLLHVKCSIYFFISFWLLATLCAAADASHDQNMMILTAHDQAAVSLGAHGIYCLYLFRRRTSGYLGLMDLPQTILATQ